MTPSINRMIKLLTNEEQLTIDKAAVITLEQKILNELSFDFNQPSPLPFLERYLRVGGLQNDQEITSDAEEYLKIAMTHITFLNFRPSLIAAAALVLSHAMIKTPLGNFKTSLSLETYFQ